MLHLMPKSPFFILLTVSLCELYLYRDRIYHGAADTISHNMIALACICMDIYL